MRKNVVSRLSVTIRVVDVELDGVRGRLDGRVHREPPVLGVPVRTLTFEGPAVIRGAYARSRARLRSHQVCAVPQAGHGTSTWTSARKAAPQRARVERAVLGTPGGACALLGRGGDRTRAPAGLRRRARRGGCGDAAALGSSSKASFGAHRQERARAQEVSRKVAISCRQRPGAVAHLPLTVREAPRIRHHRRRRPRRHADRPDRLRRGEHGRRHVARQRRQARRAPGRARRRRRPPRPGRKDEDRARRPARQGRRPQLLGLVVRAVPRGVAGARARAAAAEARRRRAPSSASRTRTSPTESRKFERDNGVTYPSLRDDKLELAPKFGTNKLPETFVLDRKGRVVAISRGQLEEPFLDERDRPGAEAGRAA